MHSVHMLGSGVLHRKGKKMDRRERGGRGGLRRKRGWGKGTKEREEEEETEWTET